MQTKILILATVSFGLQARRKKVWESALRNKALGPVEYCQKDMNQNCYCYGQMLCSSCTFAQCPLQPKAFKVKSMEQGLTGTAWRLTPNEGQELIVKFVPQTEAKASVVAAQLAHQLGVPTPRALVVTSENCPALFDEEHAKTLQRGFGDTIKVKSVALLQEFVDSKADVLPGCDMDRAPAHRSRPWVQVGIIAMFDWLIGKPDLFNDWQETISSDLGTPQNRHNIIASEMLGKAVDIDIQIGWGLRYREDFLTILDAVTSGRDLAWIRDNVLDVLDRSTFGGQAAPVELQVRLGLAYGLHDILAQSESLHQTLIKAGGKVDALALMRDKSTTGEAATLCIQLSRQLDAELRKYIAPKMEKCCEIQCSYSSKVMAIFPTKKKCAGGSQAGSFLVKKAMEGCQSYKSSLTAAAVWSQCSSVCKAGRKLYATDVVEVEREGSCN